MARLPRLAVPGHCHLVLQRAQAGAAVFADEADRRGYLAALADASAQHGLRVLAYGIDDDEARLLVEPAQAQSLSGAIQALGRRHVAAFNRRHGRRGGLWEGRFRAGIVESPGWVLPAMLLVEGVATADPADDSRSSAPHHLGQLRLPLVSDHSDYWALGNTPFDREGAYKRLLTVGVSEAQRSALMGAAEHGWVAGGAAFAARIAEQTARPTRPRARGRPRAIS